MNNLPPLEDLRLFCIVVRNRSFVASAMELGASPAFVSKRIALLEEQLGVRLLHRTTRKVSLTMDGESVYAWSLRILEDALQMAASVSSAKSTPQGLLRISSSAGFGRMHVAPVISGLATVYPDLQIQLEFYSRPVDVIGEGFDLDICFGWVPDSALLVRRISANSRILCAAPAYLERKGIPKCIEDLARHDCIAIRERSESFSVWRLNGPHGPKSVKVSGKLACSDGGISHQWAMDGHGIILRSEFDVNSSLRDKRLIRILPDYGQQADISAVYPVRLAESARVRVFVQALEERLKAFQPD